MIRVLIASPGDVAAERLAAVDVALEVNRLLGHERKVTFEPFTWERNVAPGVSTDPQAVINDQLPEFDILVGVFWTRLGTATPRAESGTLEEIESALTRRSNDPASVEILLFFSNAEVSPAAVDPEQLVGLRKFKSTLPGRGVLYVEYSELRQFEQSLRLALVAYANKDGGAPPSEDEQVPVHPSGSKADLVTPTAPITPANVAVSAEFLDSLARAEESAETANLHLELMSAAVVKLGEDLAVETDAIAEATTEKENRTHSAIAARKIINRAAACMDGYSEAVETNLPRFQSAWSDMVDGAISALAAIVPSGAIPNAETIADQVAKSQALAGTIQTAEASIGSFQSVIDRIPPATAEMRRARGRASSATGALREALREAEAMIDRLRKAWAELAPDPEPPMS